MAMLLPARAKAPAAHRLPVGPGWTDYAPGAREWPRRRPSRLPAGTASTTPHRASACHCAGLGAPELSGDDLGHSAGGSPGLAIRANSSPRGQALRA